MQLTVTASGAVASTGAISSLTVIICVRVSAAFPQASLTLQVRVMVPPQAPPTSSPSTPSTSPPASQLSVQARLIMAGTSPMQLTVTASGAAASTGDISSLMIIICSQVEAFSSLSSIL